MPEGIEKDELKLIKNALKEKGLRWEAKETGLSKLSVTERKNKCGVIYDDEDVKRIHKHIETKKKYRPNYLRSRRLLNPTPPEWDWRDVSGVNWTTPIKDQEGCGSCVAFACIAALDMMIKRWALNDSNANPDYSEAHLFFCNNRQCLPGEPNYGWWINRCLDYLKDNGVPDEACYPYEDHTQTCNTCSDWQDRVGLTKLKDWTRITNIDEMKKTISEHGCLVTRMAVFDDFFSYGGGIYAYAWGPLAGYHAVTVVGYSDVDECWICKNSWGTVVRGLIWGEGDPQGVDNGGWFRIEYDEVGIDDGMYKLETICPAEKTGIILGLDQSTIGMVRKFRDKLLRTWKGKAYLYRAMKNIGDVPKILKVLRENENLRKQAIKALEPFINSVKSLEDIKPQILKAEDFKLASDVLDKIAEIDKSLVPSIHMAKEEMPKFVGKNIRRIVKKFH